jgi:hypothetical protein
MHHSRIHQLTDRRHTSLRIIAKVQMEYSSETNYQLAVPITTDELYASLSVVSEQEGFMPSTWTMPLRGAEEHCTTFHSRAPYVLSRSRRVPILPPCRMYGLRHHRLPMLSLCNNSEIEITTNCSDALRQLHQRYGSVTIWVDATSTYFDRYRTEYLRKLRFGPLISEGFRFASWINLSVFTSPYLFFVSIYEFHLSPALP